MNTQATNNEAKDRPGNWVPSVGSGYSDPLEAIANIITAVRHDILTLLSLLQTEETGDDLDDVRIEMASAIAKYETLLGVARLFDTSLSHTLAPEHVSDMFSNMIGAIGRIEKLAARRAAVDVSCGIFRRALQEGLKGGPKTVTTLVESIEHETASYSVNPSDGMNPREILKEGFEKATSRARRTRLHYEMDGTQEAFDKLVVQIKECLADERDRKDIDRTLYPPNGKHEYSMAK